MAAQNITDARKEIETIDQRLKELEHEQNSLINKRNTLTKQLKDQVNRTPTLSVNQKIELFNKLFKGRTDVFAGRWQNSKGRSGYSVACHNEWKQGICNKPKIKCNECSNRKYKSLDDQIIYDHLAGKLVVGLYPLLVDNTCHLLVADFDKSDWQDSVKAMAQACLQSSIPHAVEISRSGNGAHIWIFFSEPVFAQDARLLGFGLLDKAMEIHPNLSFESYDRLFPNQDIMPEGGFGNLIALPLQYQARQQGNSQFVDNKLIPYPDQWHFLSQIKKLSSKELKKLLNQLKPLLSRENKIIDDLPPWEQGKKDNHTIIDHCPEQITLTLANLFISSLVKYPPP